MSKKLAPLNIWMFSLLCLWLAFLLRVWGLDFGLPYEFHPDERQYVNLTLDWHTAGQIELGFVNPPLFVYVLLLAYWPWLVLSPFTPSAQWITAAYTFARLWSVGFGMLTVALAYPLGKRLHTPKMGLLAMILLASLFLPARESHFAVNDAAATFFVLLAVYFSLKLSYHQRPLVYLLAGMAVGLAAAAKLTGGMVVLALFTAHLLSVAHNDSIPANQLFSSKLHRLLGLSMLAALVTFLLISAHIFWEIPGFLSSMAEHFQFGSGGYKGLRMTPDSGWGFYLYVLGWGMGWTMLSAALVVLGIILWRRHPKGVIVAVFPLTLFVYMGAQKILFARFILPAIPPLVVMVSLGLIWLESKWTPLQRYPALLWPLIIVVLLAHSLINLVWFNHLLTLPDTRQLATEWVIQNFPKDTVITKESYAIFPNLFLISQNWPYKTIHLDERGPTRNDIDHYVSHKTELIALSNFTFDRVRADPLAEAARRNQLAFLEEKANLIKIFSPYRQPENDGWFYLDQLYGPAAETLGRVRPGPLLKLYQLPYQSQPYTTTVPDIPNPVEANFDNKLNLLGYDLPVRRAEPGQFFPLTLYWQATSRMTETYVIFNHLLDSQQQNWGGYDRWPLETANTTLWTPGEVVIDTFNLPVSPDAPNGVYTIDIGLYNQADPTAAPLPIVRDGNPIGQNSVRIGLVKVGGPPPEAVLSATEVSPQVPLSTQLGQPPTILLRGYDLTDENSQPITHNQLPVTNTQRALRYQLTLYWESAAPTPINWSIFVHLRNQAGETVAQKDSLAGGTGATHYSTALWDIGEIIADQVTIPVPTDLPPGQYNLVIGLYNLADGMRLTVPDSVNNEIILTSWKLTP